MCAGLPPGQASLTATLLGSCAVQSGSFDAALQASTYGLEKLAIQVVFDAELAVPCFYDVLAYHLAFFQEPWPGSVLTCAVKVVVLEQKGNMIRCEKNSVKLLSSACASDISVANREYYPNQV